MDLWKDMSIPLVVSLVTTVDRAGRPNASPKTWWSPVSYQPPLLVVALKPESDTCHNIEVSGVFALHLPSRIIAKEVLHTAKPLPPGECELDDVGLPWTWYEHPKLPHPLPVVKDTPFVMCWAQSKVQTGDHTLIEGIVGVAGGFDREVGVEEVVLHRGRNRFVAIGPEFQVEPY